MKQAAVGSDEYLEAFMNGFEFVLLAMQGRLEDGTMPEDERARVDGFLEDYRRIASAYRKRRQAAAPEVALPIHGAIKADSMEKAIN